MLTSNSTLPGFSLKLSASASFSTGMHCICHVTSPSSTPSPATHPTISTRVRRKPGHARRTVSIQDFTLALTPSAMSIDVTKNGCTEPAWVSWSVIIR